MAQTVIYDLGANNGDDTEYYLKKADRVVAVEANPILCAQMQARFEPEITAGRLVVENAVLTTSPTQRQVTFYIHRTNHVLSQFPPPPPDVAVDFEPVSLPAVLLSELLERHGQAHYIKIDLEHYDAEVLRALFSAKVYPDYISAESHTIDVFRLLVEDGGYRAFKLVEGKSVADRYGQHMILSSFGREVHEFRHHSAGPFGNDIPGSWMTVDAFLHLLRIVGLGWKDIHASRIDEARPGIPRWLLPQSMS